MKRPKFQRDTDTHLFRMDKSLRRAITARDYDKARTISEAVAAALRQLCKAIERR